MANLQTQILPVSRRPARLLRGGKAGAPATLFLHGGIPGVTPFCSGAHMWESSLEPFLGKRDVIVPDLPGSGGTMPGPEPMTVDTFGRFVLDMLTAISIETVDIVGHDLGGLVGTWLALQHPGRLRSLSIVASPMTPPRGDGLDNILLASPPQPLWSRESQAWALENLSYSHMHIDAALLDACVAAAQSEAHQTAVKSMEEHYARTVEPNFNRTRYLLWEACRNEGMKVPTQVVWASHDPASSREAGFVLFNAIATHQPATQFHVVNRAGSFPFREQPAAFHHVVSAFHEGVLAETSQAA